jgi:hypothetical protein
MLQVNICNRGSGPAIDITLDLPSESPHVRLYKLPDLSIREPCILGADECETVSFRSDPRELNLQEEIREIYAVRITYFDIHGREVKSQTELEFLGKEGRVDVRILKTSLTPPSV